MAAPSAGSKANWSDITALFTEINRVRQKWGYSTVSVPSGGAGTKINQNILPTIESYIEAMNNYTDPNSGKKLIQIGYVNSSTSYPNAALVDYTIPAVGDLIRATTLSAYYTTLNKVDNVCSFNAGFNSGNVSFNSSFNSGNVSFNSSFNSGNVSFNSSFNSGNVSFNSSFNSGNNSFNSSFNSGNNSFNSGFNAGNNSFNSGFNAGNNSFNSGFNAGNNSFNSHNGSDNGSFSPYFGFYSSFSPLSSFFS